MCVLPEAVWCGIGRVLENKRVWNLTRVNLEGTTNTGGWGVGGQTIGSGVQAKKKGGGYEFAGVPPPLAKVGQRSRIKGGAF